MKKYFLASLLGFVIIIAKAQVPQLQWVNAIGGSNAFYPDHCGSIVADASGNVYTAGLTYGTIDFDPGPGTYSFATQNFSADIFVCKYTSTGALVWAHLLGGNAEDRCWSVAVDASKNVYTTGYFRSTADFDPSATGNYTLLANGVSDIFINKLDSMGNFVWTKRIGGNGDDAARDITTDVYGNIYLTGYFNNTVDFDPGPLTYNLSSTAAGDIFVAKFDPAGTFIWAKKLGGTNDEYPRSIHVDYAGNVYTIGSFKGVTDFDPGIASYSLTPVGGYDIFITKLNVAGDLVWAKQFGSADDDYGQDITTDLNGNVYITGDFANTIDFDAGPALFNLTANGFNDVFISKLNSAGNFVYAKSMGAGSIDSGYSITVDGFGNVTTTGYFADIVDFDPGIGVFNLNCTLPSVDIFVQRLNAQGNFVWAIRMGGPDNEFGLAHVLDAAGNIYVNGTFEGTANFDVGTTTTNITSAGNYDGYIAKLSLVDTSTAGLNIHAGNAVKIAVYPNPFKQKLTISAGETVSAEVFNTLSQLIIAKTINGNGSINTTELAAGVYYLNIKGSTGSKTLKIIKE